MLRERRSKIFKAKERAFHEILFSQTYEALQLLELVYTVHGNAESDVQDTILAKLRAKPPIHHIYAYIAIPSVATGAK